MSGLLLHMATNAEAWETWSRWFPYALRPVFHDLWITLQHLHEADAGADPLSDPHSDFAYPRAVLLLRHLGVHHVPVEWLGFAQGLLLTLAVVLVLRPFTARRAIGTSLLLVTPPLLLGFERANLDFALFLACAAAAWHWARSVRLRKLAWPVLVTTASALLKLYPVFALCGAALAETGRRRLVWLVAIALVAGFWCVNRAEVGLILEKLSTSTGAAWGCLVFFARVERFVTAHAANLGWLAPVNWSTVALACYGALAFGAGLAGIRWAPQFQSIRRRGAEWTYFWIGAIVCCGSFVGANLAYRWVFVLLTLPLLLRAMRSPAPAVATWARATVATILLSLGAPLTLEGPLFALAQAVNWACILLLAGGCVALRATEKSPVFAILLRRMARPRSRDPRMLPA